MATTLPNDGLDTTKALDISKHLPRGLQTLHLSIHTLNCSSRSTPLTYLGEVPSCQTLITASKMKSMYALAPTLFRIP